MSRKKKIRKILLPAKSFFFHDSSRKVMKNGEDSVWNIVKKGNAKHVEMKLVISTIILQT